MGTTFVFNGYGTDARISDKFRCIQFQVLVDFHFCFEIGLAMRHEEILLPPRSSGHLPLALLGHDVPKYEDKNLERAHNA